MLLSFSSLDFDDPSNSLESFLALLEVTKHSPIFISSLAKDWGFSTFRFFTHADLSVFVFIDSTSIVIAFQHSLSTFALHSIATDNNYYYDLLAAISSDVLDIVTLYPQRRLALVGHGSAAYLAQLFTSLYLTTHNYMCVTFGCSLPSLSGKPFFNFVHEYDSLSLIYGNHYFVIKSSLPLSSLLASTTHTLDYYILNCSELKSLVC
jgi:hypothetical protein